MAAVLILEIGLLGIQRRDIRGVGAGLRLQKIAVGLAVAASVIAIPFAVTHMPTDAPMRAAARIVVSLLLLGAFGSFIGGVATVAWTLIARAARRR